MKVLLNNTMLGYVPKEENELLSKFLRLGDNEMFEAVVNRVSPQANPEKQVGVVVRIKNKTKKKYDIKEILNTYTKFKIKKIFYPIINNNYSTIKALNNKKLIRR